MNPSAIVSEPEVKPARQAKARERAVNTCVLGFAEKVDLVYGNGYFEKIAKIGGRFPNRVDPADVSCDLSSLEGVEAIFSTWGMPEFSHRQLESLPSLRAVFHAAGSVRGFARPLLERGITVVSAWRANAIPTAEFTLAQILLAAKGYFRNTREFNKPSGYLPAFRGPGNFGETVALLGAGAIGRNVIEFLRPFSLEVIVFDPFLPEEEARVLGVEKVSLQAAFERGYVVSNHLANLPETVGMLHGGLFERMRRNATFINTGRGATIVEEAMIHVLKMRPDLTALLDVTFPEPPVEGSPLYTLPNVALSTHIAGSIGDELGRMVNYCLEEFAAWRNGASLKHPITLPMFERMA